jgi:hypothetical protein
LQRAAFETAQGQGKRLLLSLQIGERSKAILSEVYFILSTMQDGHGRKAPARLLSVRRMKSKKSAQFARTDRDDHCARWFKSRGSENGSIRRN